MGEIHTVPIICTRGVVIFPNQQITIDVGRKESMRGFDYAQQNGTYVFMTAQKSIETDHPSFSEAFEIGCICKIVKVIKHQANESFYQVTLLGVARAKAIRYMTLADGTNAVEAEWIQDYYQDELIVKDLMLKVLGMLDKVKRHAAGPFNIDFIKTLSFGSGAAELTDRYAQMFLFDFNEKQKFLEEADVTKRLTMTLESIQRLIKVDEIDAEIEKKVRESMEDSQRNYYLREKVRAIKNELNDGPTTGDEDELRELVNNEPYPEHVKVKALEEIDKMEMLPPAGGEYGVVRTYLDWLLKVPWWQKSEDNEDINEASKILDEDHFGLKKVKERILEYLAVKQMTASLKSPILCLVGPPGVGKTSLARSVARALGRNFVKISLGGVRDEAEIRGHRRTYLGALPGRIIQGMKKAGTLNPVFLIDEIDKMASDYKGDPSSAMLEVLDPEQNNAFSDHYLEEPYDLSDVLFIATANYIENIPPALKDRLEIIEISSYTEIEKLNIAKEHLLRKQLEANGLKPSQFKISDDIIMHLIRHYTREAGVRQLERTIGSLCRKVVLEILAKKKTKVTVTKKLIDEWLGPEIYEYGTKEKKDQVGVVTGLAYTSFGGDVLSVEVNYFEGSGKFIVTGQLGDVMKESTRIALDYIKANAKKYGIDPKFFDTHDIHVHVPEGAVPKDGPSAGVTLSTAIVSAITGRKVHSDVAMTGEVTLRGNVLPIGGLKEKSLAAHRSGIKTIIIPKLNVKDLRDVPETVKEDVEFIPVESVDQVFKRALV